MKLINRKSFLIALAALSALPLFGGANKELSKKLGYVSIDKMPFGLPYQDCVVIDNKTGKPIEFLDSNIYDYGIQWADDINGSIGGIKYKAYPNHVRENFRLDNLDISFSFYNAKGEKYYN